MIALNETNEYAAEVAFTLPLVSDPLTGLTGWTFTLGEVQVKLPGGAWTNVAVNKIVEKGYGRYCARLTSSQTTTAGIVSILANVSGAQPYFGVDTIGELGGDIPQLSTGYMPFYLPNETDPVYGAPVSTANFSSSGTLRICLPDAVYRDATTAEKAAVINLGNGGYLFTLDSSLTTKKGKAFLYASYTGAQRFEGYSTILGFGAATTSATTLTPISVPNTLTSPTSTLKDLITAAAGRLCEYSKSGNFDAGEFVDNVG